MHRILLILGVLFHLQSMGQNTTQFTADSIDSIYGITHYVIYNPQLGGKEVRLCNGIPCNQYVTDLYADGAKLHKGYYQNGTLKIFKNFYPNGNTERDFKWVDDRKCTLKIYYESGALKSKVKYLDGNPISWQDFYENGNPDYIEEYDDDYQFYLKQYSYNQDGTPMYLLDLKKKSKKLYYKKEYENGVLRSEGPVKYDAFQGAYFQTGWWTIYNESGKVVKKVEYAQGKIVTEEEG